MPRKLSPNKIPGQQSSMIAETLLCNIPYGLPKIIGESSTIHTNTLEEDN